MNLPKKNSAKIVQQALSFQKPDRLPVFDGFWSEFVDLWREKYHLPDTAEITDDYWIDMKVAVADETLFPTRIREVKKDGEFSLMDDGWGRIVRTKPGTYFCEPVERVFNQPSDLDKICFDPANLDCRYPRLVQDSCENHRKGRAVFVKIGGLFIRSTFFRGEVEFLMDLAEDEAFAKALVEKMESHFLQVGLESLRRADACDFGLWIYDDMCNSNAPMFSPGTFERVFLPSYKRMISAFKAAGARWVFLHCDGNLRPFLDLLIEAGFNGINPVEPAAGMDVVKLIEKYHGRLSFVGGVCNSHILPGGDEKKIRRHVEAIVDAGKNGGLVIGTHSIGPDVPVENYELYRRIISERGTYKK
jgi:uroporphyrinogen decarboxylase